ncbi:MAG TPA: triose-phosphate isomerase [Chloroflexota bacterium]|nr:triose-phosphate isomerase [Chloroflexota bacterium]
MTGSARIPIIAANWKMHTTPGQARDLAAETVAAIPAHIRAKVEVVLCPPFIALDGVRAAVEGAIPLGAQNMHWEAQGAFTGEISPTMLVPWCQYVILGHSERRQYFGETNEQVHRKVRAAFAHNLTPIVCVGESLAQREAGETHAWVALQVREALHGIPREQLATVVLAYEPIWAIGTGKTASGPDANAVAAMIREVVASIGDASAAQAARIQYGGSVNGANAAEFLSQPDIDGALVGGASLKPEEFARIVGAAANQ